MNKFKSLNDLKSLTLIDTNGKSYKSIVESNKKFEEKYGSAEIKFPIKEAVIYMKEIAEGSSAMLRNPIYKEDYIYYKILKDDNNNDSLEVLLESYAIIEGEFHPQFGAMLKVKDGNPTITELSYEIVELLNGRQKNLMQIPNRKAFIKARCGMLLDYLIFIWTSKLNSSVTYKSVNKDKNESSNKNINNKKNNREKIHILNDDKIVYIVEGDKNTLKSFKKYNRKTDSWNVSGHYRRYKSGLVKWIDEYSKGIGEKKNKKYKIK